MPANVQSMFYIGNMPWHKEGVALKEPPDCESAIKCAGLDWTVSKVKLYTEFGDHPIPDFYGVMRSDNAEVLGVVGNDYTPLQNRDAFKFFDPLISSGFLQYETAGALGAGEIIWVLAKIKSRPLFVINGKDEVNKYLLLSSSHDGSSAVSIKFTPIRVVCQNTLNIALGHGDATKIQHLTGIHKKLRDVQIAAESICRIYSDVEGIFQAMAEKGFSDKQAHDYFNSLFPIPNEDLIKSEAQYREREKIFNLHIRLMNNFGGGYGIREYGVGNTLWAAYNAITQYIDHPTNYKLGDNKLIKRIWFGGGETIKKRAYIKAVNLLSAT